MPDAPAPPGRDARFADADADRPLAIRAEDARDLAVLAALAQDAVLTAADMAWDARARRLSLLVSRFRWEDAEAARAEGRPFERVRALLVVGDALRVRHDGIDRDDPGTVLSLLNLAWQPGPDGTGTLMTMRMTLPDAETRAAMLATGMEEGMEASYARLETMI